MPSDSTRVRVHRPLTGDELAHIHTEITAATNTSNLLMRAFRAMFTPLLADVGASIDDLGEDNKLRTGHLKGNRFRLRLRWTYSRLQMSDRRHPAEIALLGEPGIIHHRKPDGDVRIVGMLES